MDLKAFVKSAVKQRQFLLRSNRNRKNVMLVSKCLDKFRLYLDFYPQATNSQIKKFILRNFREFEIILPGEGAPGAKSRYEQFYKLLIQTS